MNRLNGDALVSNGTLFSGTKTPWEEFDGNPEKFKAIFEKEYNAAINPEGGDIRYTHVKLTQTVRQFQKISIIYGFPELNWLVGAGVYIDDVKTDITRMQTELNRQIKTRVVCFALAVIFVAGPVFFSYNRVNQKFKNDFDLFDSFLKNAATTRAEINRKDLKFIEFERIADASNTMIKEQKRIEENLKESQERLKSTLQTNPDPVVVYDTKGFPQFINPSFTRVFGLTFEEIREILEDQED